MISSHNSPPPPGEAFERRHLIQEETQSSFSIAFLSREEDITMDSLGELRERGRVVLLDKENYYFSVFNLLEKIFPALNVEEIIKGFRESEEVREQEELEARDALHTELTPKTMLPLLFKKEGFNLLGGVLLGLTLVCVLFVILREYKLQNSTPYADSSIRSDLILPATSFFLERPALLKQINDKLKNQDNTVIKTVALVGVGGAGKSTLARYYARTQKKPVVWEVNAGTKESLRASFEVLAYALSKTEEEKKELKTILESKNASEKEDQFFVFLKKHLRSYPNWLLIYDDVNTFRDIQDYFPHDATVWGRGEVIITTQDANIHNTSYINSTDVIHVEGLDKEERLVLFTKILNLETAQDFEEKLLQEIPPFPLDVSTAAYFLKETKIPYEQYREHMLTQTKSFATTQENTLQSIGKYTKSRYGIVTLSLKNIMDKNKDFKGLLWLIILIGSENIPKELLTFYKGDSLAQSFLHEVKRRSLILEKPENTATFSLHGSIHKIIVSYLRDSLSPEEKAHLAREAVKTLEKYLIHILDKEDIKKIKNLSPHLEQLLTHQDLLTPAEKASLQGGLGCLYYYQGFDEKAKELLETSQKDLSQYSQSHSLQLANVLDILGGVYRMTGRYEEARMVLEQALLLYRKHYPEEHVNMAWTLACLGNVYKKLGQYEEAKIALEKSILIYKTHHTNNYVDVGWALVNLGNVYRKLGETKKARVLLEEALKINEQHLEKRDEDFSEALTSSLYLGSAYRHLGDAEKAKEVLEKALQKHKEVFGEDNIRTARASSHLAKAYEGLKHYKKAEALFQKSLEIYEKQYGPHHIQTGRILRSFGQNYLLQDLLEPAETYLHQALNIFQQNNHPEAYRCLENLADLSLKKASLEAKKGNTEHSQAFTREALDFLTQALDVINTHFPKDSPHKTRLQEKVHHLESGNRFRSGH